MTKPYHPTVHGYLMLGKNIFLVRTIDTYLPSINSTVTDFHCMRKYVECLQSLATAVDLAYVTIGRWGSNECFYIYLERC